MIKLKNLQNVTTLISERLTKEEEINLAEDIKNWLFAEKSIYADVEIK